MILYRHPILDRKFGLADDHPVMTDDEIERLIADFVRAAKLAQRAGFDFVDLKHCHGYLGHEFLSAVDRPGKFGGSLENRTRFFRELVAGIRAEAPGLEMGVRLSAVDIIPFRPIRTARRTRRSARVFRSSGTGSTGARSARRRPSRRSRTSGPPPRSAASCARSESPC